MLLRAVLWAMLFSCTVAAPLLATGLPPELPVRVELGLYLIDVTSFDQRENTFGIELDVVSRWRDPRRGFTPDAGEPAFRLYRDDQALAELSSGWSPELHIVNSVGTLSLGIVRTRINSDGTTVNRIRLQGVLRAPLDFRMFPFDEQMLPIRVESYSWQADQLQITLAEDFTGFAPGYETPEWELLRLSTAAETVLRQQEQAEYSRMTFQLHVKRQSGYYIWKILLPLLVITAISWVVFWMSEDALGRRAGISATGMLTVIAYQMILADALPRFPYLTLMDKVALLTLIIIAMTMLENIISSRLPTANRQRMDRTCRVAFPVVYYTLLSVLLWPVLG